jgi:hypothetical protein
MHRRDFLKVAGLATASLAVWQLAPASAGTKPPVQATVGGRMWRGTPDGKVSVSDNGGQSWRLHTDFGTELAVHRFAPMSGSLVRATLSVKGHEFDLRLDNDDVTWRTI